MPDACICRPRDTGEAPAVPDRDCPAHSLDAPNEASPVATWRIECPACGGWFVTHLRSDIEAFMDNHNHVKSQSSGRSERDA